MCAKLRSYFQEISWENISKLKELYLCYLVSTVPISPCTVPSHNSTQLCTIVQFFFIANQSLKQPEGMMPGPHNLDQGMMATSGYHFDLINWSLSLMCTAYYVLYYFIIALQDVVYDWACYYLFLLCFLNSVCHSYFPSLSDKKF